jgi:hypothetical protein
MRSRVLRSAFCHHLVTYAPPPFIAQIAELLVNSLRRVFSFSHRTHVTR